jgi:TolB-like protein/Tfp pilus assembly protein PilF
MSSNPNKISQFWQELKRRRVIHVIVVYATAAFVIIELINNVTEPLNLPDWTPTFVIVILAIGFPLAIIFSWIFDVTPEGIEKTKPIRDIQDREKMMVPNSWRIATYASVVIIIGLVAINVFGGRNRVIIDESLDKSIAVLPFRNDSPDEEKMYFINGTMGAILDNLSGIKDLRVPGRISVEQYRDVSKPVPVIAEELNVSYILGGSGQKLENRILLTVQLMEGKTGTQLWSERYDQEIERVEDLIDIQSEIAQSVAVEIKAIITLEEEEQINKVPTTSLTAYDFYQQGRQEMWNFTYGIYEREELDNAAALFNRALEYDSLFAPAYAELAKIYYEKFELSGHIEQSYLDSLKHFVDIALSIDDDLALAHSLRGNYYYINVELEKALIEFNKAREINPNDYMIYLNLGRLSNIDDAGQAIYNYKKATSLLSGTELAIVLNQLSGSFSLSGFFQQGKLYAEEALALGGDSLSYIGNLAEIEFQSFNHGKAIELLLEGYSMGSTNTSILLLLVWHYMYLDQFKVALKYVRQWIENRVHSSYFDYNMMHRVGYVLWQNGLINEAERYFNMQKEYCERINELGQIRSVLAYTYYDLAGTYAFQGEKEKAYENLRIFNQKETSQWLGMIRLIKTDPLFSSIRDEPEFQQIVRDVELKSRREHERVRQWLEENDML